MPMQNKYKHVFSMSGEQHMTKLFNEYFLGVEIFTIELYMRVAVMW